MEQEAARYGVTVDWRGPSDPDPQQQIDLLTKATSENRYGIAINPVGINSTNGAVSGALSKGIPVVVLRDSLSLKQRSHLSFLLEDEEAGAKLIAHRLLELFPRGGDVVILGIDPSSPSSLSRLDAVDAALRADCPKMHVVDRVIAPFNSGRVQVEAEKALDLHSSLVAFIALSAQAGGGAVAAVGSRPSRKDVKTIAFEQSLPLLLRLRLGVVDSVVTQDMRRMGQLAVDNIVNDRRGRPYPAIQYIAPILVTRENINSDRVQNALQLNWVSQ